MLVASLIGPAGFAVADQHTTVDVAPQKPAILARDPEPFSTGWHIVLDNDVIASSGRDKDYTAGFAVTLGGSRIANYRLSLDRPLAWLDRLLFRDMWLQRTRPDHMMQFGLLLFTPELDSVNNAQFDDRPFANLLFVENSRFRYNRAGRHAFQSSFTIGVLGTGIGEAVQNAVHHLGDIRPTTGYEYQISDGGELTARYAVTRQTLLLSVVDRRGTSFDLKYRLGGDIGYITEASVGFAARWGRVASPWWGFAPTRNNYLPQSVAKPRRSLRREGGREFYVWSAVTLHARAYNVFLQGQFRDSLVTFSADELNHFIAELSIGVNQSFGRNFDISLALHQQSNEVRHGVAARNTRWGSLTITRSF